MKRTLYLSLLLIIPFLLHAEHGRDKLNGKWISPYYDTQIKIKVKRHEIKVKGISRHGWVSFSPIKRNVFQDCEGNRIRIKNIHDLVYTNRYRKERIRFVKKGHQHHNHICNNGCSIGNDFFNYDQYGSGYHNYGNDFDDDADWSYDNSDYYGSYNIVDNYPSNKIDGKYHVREIDEYVTLKRTNRGLKAKRGSGNWIEYIQNRNRKNEYKDKNGNSYLMRSNGEITWRRNDGKVSLNLKK